MRPWVYHSWLFPRDPQFLGKACVVLELYQRRWQGVPLGPKDYVLSVDEKSQLQILPRLHATRPPISQHVGQVEFEYDRLGTLTYQAALDVHRGIVIGQIQPTNCIATFNQLVPLVMNQPPYDTAERVFWLVDNGSSHYPTTFPARLAGLDKRAIAVHLPFHASWLNQIELYFSILTRKALTPHDLNAAEMVQRILGFEKRFNAAAQPFNWRFTADDLRQRMKALTLALP